MKVIKETIILTVAVFIVAAAVFFFLIPSHTAISSIAGLSIVLANFIPLKVSVITFIINIFLLILGFITCGKEFGVKTVYTSLMMPVFIGMFEMMYPNFTSFTNDQMLDSISYVFVVSIGLSILFNRNASSGGLDIIAKILNKYFNVDLGKAMSLAGIVISLSSVFAYDGKTVVLSLFGTYLNGVVLDQFIFEQTLKRRVCIVSDKNEEIRKFIINNLHSGATIYKVIGAYNFEARDEIITIVDRSEYQKLLVYLKKTDPKAFITVYKVSGMYYRPKV